MKTPTPAQREALAAYAARITRTLPPLAHEADGRLTPESREALNTAMRRVLRRGWAVGGTLVLAHPGGATDVLCFGHARLRPRLPVTEQTCFRVASVSKLVMTFGALSLVEDGLLALDADISALLGYTVRCPAAPDTPLTLRMLLTHTACLRDDGPYATRGMQPGCTLRELLTDPQSFAPRQPGSAFLYSNLGAGVAGVLMERAAHTPLDAIMQARVFAPLGIRASYDPRRVQPVSDLADGYAVRPPLPPIRRYDAAALAARPDAPFDPEQDYLCAAGRLITDAKGMATLIRLLASHGEMGVLSAASLDCMRKPQDELGGLGVIRRGLNTAALPDVFPGYAPVGHQGVAYGMCAELFADPVRGAGVGVMTSGVRLIQQPPLVRTGAALLALGFAALAADRATLRS